MQFSKMIFLQKPKERPELGKCSLKSLDKVVPSLQGFGSHQSITFPMSKYLWMGVLAEVNKTSFGHRKVNPNRDDVKILYL